MFRRCRQFLKGSLFIAGAGAGVGGGERGTVKDAVAGALGVVGGVGIKQELSGLEIMSQIAKIIAKTFATAAPRGRLSGVTTAEVVAGEGVFATRLSKPLIPTPPLRTILQLERGRSGGVRGHVAGFRDESAAVACGSDGARGQGAGGGERAGAGGGEGRAGTGGGGRRGGGGGGERLARCAVSLRANDVAYKRVLDRLRDYAKQILDLELRNQRLQTQLQEEEEETRRLKSQIRADVERVGLKDALGQVGLMAELVGARATLFSGLCHSANCQATLLDMIEVSISGTQVTMDQLMSASFCRQELLQHRSQALLCKVLQLQQELQVCHLVHQRQIDQVMT